MNASTIINDTLTIGTRYTVRDIPTGRQWTPPGISTLTHWTGKFTGIEDTMAGFVTDGGYTLWVDSFWLADAIKNGDITIIDTDAQRSTTAQLNARLPHWTHELIDLICETTGMTKTQVLINAIEAYADKIHSDGLS